MTRFGLARDKQPRRRLARRARRLLWTLAVLLACVALNGLRSRTRRPATGAAVRENTDSTTTFTAGLIAEPQQVERILQSYDDIREALVISRHDATPTLTGYVVPSTTARSPAVAELRARLRRDLSPWQVPTEIVMLSALPRDATGQVDLTALPGSGRPAFVPPHEPHEVLVSRLWADVLGVEPVGLADSFYALGGDSLSAATMLVTLRESHGISLRASDLASAPTLAKFASRAAASKFQQAPNPPSLTTVPVRAISQATQGTPLFCFTGVGASALSFAPLTARVGAQTAVYALEPKGLHQRAVPDLSVARAAQRHLPEVRRIQPDGPYTLIGHSLGGHIALEVARLLESDGADVELVVLLDPWLPPHVARDARHDIPDVVVTLQDLDAAGGMDLWWDRQKRIPLAGLFFGGYERRTLALEEFGMMTGYFHRMRPWGGRTHLLLSHLNKDDPRLWPRILTGDLTVEVVDCDHHSIIREPHVSAVADLLREFRQRTEVDNPAGSGQG